MRLRNRSWLIACILLICSTTVTAAVQRLRIPAGTYTIGNKGTRLPAYCVDRHGDTPRPWNSFVKGSPSISVQRLQGGLPIGPPKTFDDATSLVDPWLKFKGNNTYWSLEVAPVREEEGISYQLDVNDTFGAIGDEHADIASLLEAWKRGPRDPIAQFDSDARTLIDLFGYRSGIVRTFNAE